MSHEELSTLPRLAPGALADVLLVPGRNRPADQRGRGAPVAAPTARRLQPHVKVRRALVKGRMGPPKSRYGAGRSRSITRWCWRSASAAKRRSGPAPRTSCSRRQRGAV